ncbi:4-hydroxyproline epimerase [Gluconacetobacter takamatsuzukensis]|uniref:4-hydroxyproline epimerase n=1 Tax=Gluconacetobacter takamatsuzukensis TaxID=1286190 RepID=A0A7W4KEP0_9PROT|nr:4-hydroxyproline epimerase [Gluconacetobacter takamatsuzukensis]MBB2205533.1 4-hydroxyproline epimerase [Gluconacetobacter takamatsuzukensis]
MRHTFFCIDGHTAGNPVRLVAGGAPLLRGATMGERRLDFLARFDWIRTGLCFEPRGHSMMSGGFLYPPSREDSDGGILFIETSGCLPMCGHGTIGLVTFGLEHGLLHPRVPGRLRLEVPAGMIDIEYTENQGRVTGVRIRNVPAYVAATGIGIEVPGLDALTVDVAYGGNYYAIVEPQGAYTGLDALGARRILELSPQVREAVRARFHPVHPADPAIEGVSHVLWADRGLTRAGSRNAVFYGDNAIDRSPCGTGTSARLAHLHHKGLLAPGEPFVHESYIHSRFIGTIESETTIPSPAGPIPAIVPLIEGSAISTGFNTIWIEPEDQFRHGFQVI